jgi:hypothetical protein
MALFQNDFGMFEGMDHEEFRIASRRGGSERHCALQPGFG